MTDREALVREVTKEVMKRLAEETNRDVAAPIRRGGNMMPREVAPPAGGDVELASRIDHTLLRPEADVQAIDRICDEAARHHFASVCINPTWVAHAASRLSGTGVRVCTVVGFPLGAMREPIKAVEASRAVRDGATEIDMVVNVGEAKSGRFDVVRRDIETVRRAIGSAATLKTILETASLDEAEKRAAALAALEAGADFLKTSTGFGRGGATEADVRLLAEAAAGRGQVKASGGIRNREDALRMIAAGADRIGASSSVAIVTGGSGSDTY